jgi:hypothetical protein
LLTLNLSGVLPVVQHHCKATGFAAGQLNTPRLHMPDSAPDGLPVQLGLVNERFGSGCSNAHTQAGRFAVPHECLLPASRAGQTLDCPGGQIHPLGKIWGFVFLRSCHAD